MRYLDNKYRVVSSQIFLNFELQARNFSSLAFKKKILEHEFFSLRSESLGFTFFIFRDFASISHNKSFQVILSNLKSFKVFLKSFKVSFKSFFYLGRLTSEVKLFGL